MARSVVILLICMKYILSVNSDSDQQGYSIGDEEFQYAMRSSKPHFVLFYSPKCGHCTRMEPAWNELAQYYNEKNTGLISIVQIDCTVNKDICTEQEVRGYPTMRLYVNDNDNDSVDFEGERTFEKFKDFVMEALQDSASSGKKARVSKTGKGQLISDGLHYLTDSDFGCEISRGDMVVFFYQKDCTVSSKLQPVWKELAKSFADDDDIRIGQVECTEQSELCKTEGILRYPTLNFYHGGRMTESRHVSHKTNMMTGYTKHTSRMPPTAIDQDQSNVVELTDETFEDAVSDGITFLKLYAPGCGICKRMAVTWDQLAEEDFTQAAGPVTIARLDCIKYPDICRANGGFGFLTLVVLIDGEPAAIYDGPRTVAYFKQFLLTISNGYMKVPDGIREANKYLITDGLYNLTEYTFYHQTMEGDWFIHYIMPGCEICAKTKEAWKEVAKMYEGRENVNIAEVDCWKSSVICGAHGVQGHPTLKFYRDAHEMEGRFVSANIEELKSYIESKTSEPTLENTESKVRELTDKTFYDVIEKGITFVKFYLPQCGFCVRMARAWDQLAEEDFSDASGPVTIAKLDCEQYNTICMENQVRGIPSLVLMMDGRVVATYGSASQRDAKSLKKFVAEMSNGYRLTASDQKRDEL